MTAKTKKKLLSFLFQLLAIAVGLLLIFPILYAISLSFMKAPEILTGTSSFCPIPFSGKTTAKRCKSPPWADI